MASVMKVERSAWSRVNALKRPDVSSATDSATTTPSTNTATRTVVRRRLAGADCTAPSYDAACARLSGAVATLDGRHDACVAVVVDPLRQHEIRVHNARHEHEDDRRKRRPEQRGDVGCHCERFH